MNEQLRKFLRRNDEAGAYEFPTGFNYPLLERRALEVDRRLREQLGETTTFEGAVYNQDASFSISICFKAYERSEDRRLYLPCLRFSNFGGMVSSVWETMIPPDRFAAIIEIVREEGFEFVPSSDLDARYDGVMEGKFESWWMRYFDWI